MRAAGRIFQPVRGRGLRKLLWKRLHLPRAVVHGALRTAKRAANPRQLRLRREHAEQLSDEEPTGRIPQQLGYLPFGPEALPGAEAAAARCAALHRAAALDAQAQALRFNPRKDYLLALQSGADFCAHPDLIRFMISRPVLDTATRYLGTVPLLAGAALWWTPPNDSAERSQLFHLDGEDERQVKLLLNVLPTSVANGPFTLLPADRSAPLRSARGMRRRFPDEQVEQHCGLAHAVTLTGAPGSGAFVDTSRCLHYGSRRTRSERLVLMVQFLRFDCPTESTFDLVVPPDLPGLDPDPVQKLALGIA